MVFTVESNTAVSTAGVPHPNTENPATMSAMVSQFSQETSLHGVKFIINSYGSKPRRLFWGTIVVVQISLLLFVMVEQFKHVNDRPLLTKVITRYVSRLPFPAITLCDDRLSVKNYSMSPFEEDVFENLAKMNETFFTLMSPEEYQSIDLASVYKAYYSSGEELVESCLFGNMDCRQLVRKAWGKQALCYNVNSLLDGEETPGNEHTVQRLISTVPGAELGLWLVLRLGGDTGIKLIVHEPDEKITLTNSEFLQLAPGHLYYIGLKVRQNKFLPSPYKAFGDRECVVTSGDFRHPLVPHGRYTLRACHDACYLKTLEIRCGCKLELTENSAICDCPFPCEDVVYDTTLSSIPLPSFYGRSNNSAARKITINIHFDRLRIESTQQVEDYTREDVFASVGGQLGLFLGASIITLIELVELLVRCGWRWMARSRVKR